MRLPCRGGRFETRGDAPVSGVDFEAGLRDDSGYTSGGGDLVIGDTATGNGTVNVEGGELAVARDALVGFDGVARLRVQGAASTMTIGGDLSFGGNYAGAAAGSGVLEIALTGSGHSSIDVVGGTDDGVGGTVPGDLLIWNGALEPGFGSGYSIPVGDYTSAPLEWKIIDFAGSREGAFSLDGGYLDGSTNGAIWGVRYDDAAGEVYLQALQVLVAPASPGDFNGDGFVDSADYTVWRDNLGGDASTLLGNGSGGSTVTGADYDLWKSLFGTSYNTGTAIGQQPVPEPSTFGLVGLVIGATLAVRRGHCMARQL